MAENNNILNARKVLLVIPCYNEAKSIGPLLEEISSLGLGYQTLVVDDGSEDETYAVASRSSMTIRLAENSGIGAAVQTGIRYALEMDYDFCVQLDGDGQHPPVQVAALLREYDSTSSNLVIGSRFLKGGDFMSTPMRRVGISLISNVIGLLYRKRITDPTSGLRLMDRRAIEYFSTNYPRDYPEPNSIALAIKNNLNISEVPVNMRTREHGSSSIAGLRMAAYMLRVIGYLVLHRFG